MKVAFAVSENRGMKSKISESFGKSRGFVFVDIAEDGTKGFEYVGSPTHAFGAFPQFLADSSIKVLVCDRIGEKAREMLDTHGITVFSQYSGTIDKVLEHLLPKLVEIETRAKEEEEAKKKQALALQRARERQLTYTIIKARDPVILIKVSDEDYVLIDINGKLYLLKPRGELDTDESPDKYDALKFRGSRFLGSRRLSISEEEGIRVGTELYEVVEQREGKIPEKMSDLIMSITSADDPSSKKEEAKELNDLIYELLNQEEQT